MPSIDTEELCWVRVGEERAYKRELHRCEHKGRSPHPRGDDTSAHDGRSSRAEKRCSQNAAHRPVDYEGSLSA